MGMSQRQGARDNPSLALFLCQELAEEGSLLFLMLWESTGSIPRHFLASPKGGQ